MTKASTYTNILIGSPNELPLIRAPFTYNPDANSLATGLSCPEPTLAQQHCKDETDLNIILEKMTSTGQMPFVDQMGGYGDFSDAQDYHTIMNRLIEAQNSFNGLDARIRDRFANDPGRLMDFLSDESNRDEAIKLGLVSKPEFVPPVPPVAASPE